MVQSNKKVGNPCFKKCNRGGGGGEEDIVKNDGGVEMVVVFTNTEINYLVVNLFFHLVRAISYLYLWFQVL